jgi:hypothetical protein
VSDFDGASFLFREDRYADGGTYSVGGPSNKLVVSNGSTVNLTPGAAIVGPAPTILAGLTHQVDYLPSFMPSLSGVLVQGEGSTLNVGGGTVGGSSGHSASVGLGMPAVLVAGGVATIGGGTFRGGDGQFPGVGLKQAAVLDSSGTITTNDSNGLPNSLPGGSSYGTVNITGGSFVGGDSPMPNRAIWETGVGAAFQGIANIGGGTFTPGRNSLYALHYRGAYADSILTISGGVFHGDLALHTSSGTAVIQGTGLSWTPGDALDDWSSGQVAGTLTSGDPINALVVFPPGITITATSSQITFGPSGQTRTCYCGPRDR